MAENDVEPDETPAETKKLPTTPVVDKSQYVVVADADVLAASTPKREATPARGPLKPESLTTDYVVVTDPAATEKTEKIDAQGATAVLPAVAPEQAATTPTPQIVYRESPVPPKGKGNRGFGVVVAIGASVIFAVILAFAVLLILRSIRGYATMSMLANYGYWVPVGLFLVGLILVALLVNRAGWWAHIIASAVVAIWVYFGSAILIAAIGFYALHQNTTFAASVTSPTAIAAGIIAREVALWAGVLISRRGRSVRAKNLEERAAFDSEQTTVSA